MDSLNIHSVLAIDAAKFKEVKGNIILKKSPFCTNINPDKIYNNVFIFYLQPLNCNYKPFPVYVHLAENGSANDEILSLTDLITDLIEKQNVTIHFVATDGDHKFDEIHERFFTTILDAFKSKLSFQEIIQNISDLKIKKLPLSDFFPSIKNLRSYLIKFGIELDFSSKATILKENLINVDIGKALSDISQNGKMKKQLPVRNIL